MQDAIASYRLGKICVDIKAATSPLRRSPSHPGTAAGHPGSAGINFIYFFLSMLTLYLATLLRVGQFPTLQAPLSLLLLYQQPGVKAWSNASQGFPWDHNARAAPLLFPSPPLKSSGEVHSNNVRSRSFKNENPWGTPVTRRATSSRERRHRAHANPV